MSATTPIASSEPGELLNAPRFYPDQILNEEDLNYMVNYLSGQHTLTRRLALGTGIVTGFGVNVSDPISDRHMVTLLPGSAITSDGHLVRSSETKWLSDPMPVMDITKFPKLPQIVPTKGQIQEVLARPVRELEEGELAPRLPADTLADRVLVIYHQRYVKQAEKCFTTDCYDASASITFAQRYLLVKRELVNAWLSENQQHNLVENSPLADLKMPRVLLSESALKNLSTLRSQYKAVILGNYTARLGENLERLQNVLAPWLIEEAPLWNTEDYETLQKVIGAQWDALMDIQYGFQYAYDWLRDLTEAYRELRERILDILVLDHSVAVDHPRHIMVGHFYSQKTKFSHYRYRHHGIKKTAERQFRDLHPDIRSLYHRLRHLIEQFTVHSEDTLSLRITPTAPFQDPMGRRAIPFYYDYQKPTHGHRQKEWLINWPGGQVRNQEQPLPNLTGYWWHRESPSHFVTQPLDYTYGNRTFVRVEGLQGMPLESVQTALRNSEEFTGLIHEKNLPFDVVYVPLDSGNYHAPVTETTGLPEGFSDLQEHYRTHKAYFGRTMKDVLWLGSEIKGWLESTDGEGTPIHERIMEDLAGEGEKADLFSQIVFDILRTQFEHIHKAMETMQASLTDCLSDFDFDIFQTAWQASVPRIVEIFLGSPYVQVSYEQAKKLQEAIEAMSHVGQVRTYQYVKLPKDLQQQRVVTIQFGAGMLRQVALSLKEGIDESTEEAEYLRPWLKETMPEAFNRGIHMLLRTSARVVFRKFQLLHTHYQTRVAQLQGSETRSLASFWQAHPSLQHLAGTYLRGTLVVAYTEVDGTPTVVADFTLPYRCCGEDSELAVTCLQPTLTAYPEFVIMEQGQTIQIDVRDHGLQPQQVLISADAMANARGNIALSGDGIITYHVPKPPAGATSEINDTANIAIDTSLLDEPVKADLSTETDHSVAYITSKELIEPTFTSKESIAASTDTSELSRITDTDVAKIDSISRVKSISTISLAPTKEAFIGFDVIPFTLSSPEHGLTDRSFLHIWVWDGIPGQLNPNDNTFCAIPGQTHALDVVLNDGLLDDSEFTLEVQNENNQWIGGINQSIKLSNAQATIRKAVAPEENGRDALPNYKAIDFEWQSAEPKEQSFRYRISQHGRLPVEAEVKVDWLQALANRIYLEPQGNQVFHPLDNDRVPDHCQFELQMSATGGLDFESIPTAEFITPRGTQVYITNKRIERLSALYSYWDRSNLFWCNRHENTGDYDEFYYRLVIDGKYTEAKVELYFREPLVEETREETLPVSQQEILIEAVEANPWSGTSTITLGGDITTGTHGTWRWLPGSGTTPPSIGYTPKGCSLSEAVTEVISYTLTRDEESVSGTLTLHLQPIVRWASKSRTADLGQRTVITPNQWCQVAGEPVEARGTHDWGNVSGLPSYYQNILTKEFIEEDGTRYRIYRNSLRTYLRTILPANGEAPKIETRLLQRGLISQVINLRFEQESAEPYFTSLQVYNNVQLQDSPLFWYREGFHDEFVSLPERMVRPNALATYAPKGWVFAAESRNTKDGRESRILAFDISQERNTPLPLRYGLRVPEFLDTPLAQWGTVPAYISDITVATYKGEPALFIVSEQKPFLQAYRLDGQAIEEWNAAWPPPPEMDLGEQVDEEMGLRAISAITDSAESDTIMVLHPNAKEGGHGLFSFEGEASLVKAAEADPTSLLPTGTEAPFSWAWVRDLAINKGTKDILLTGDQGTFVMGADLKRYYPDQGHRAAASDREFVVGTRNPVQLTVYRKVASTGTFERLTYNNEQGTLENLSGLDFLPRYSDGTKAYELFASESALAADPEYPGRITQLRVIETNVEPTDKELSEENEVNDGLTNSINSDTASIFTVKSETVNPESTDGNQIDGGLTDSINPDTTFNNPEV